MSTSVSAAAMAWANTRQAGAALATLAAAISSAHGQSADKAGADAAQTITITATRRLEPIRDVPVAITKIATDAQLDLGAKDLTDVLQSVPGVSLVTGGRSSLGAVVIRGVNSGSAPNPTVGIYLDDVPVGGTSGAGGGGIAFDQRLLDLASIEVLKGPQGTLYGASTMGGLLKYNTRIPETALFSALVGAEASRTAQGGNSYTVQGYVNAPLSAGVAAVRAAAFTARDGGYIDAIGPAGGKDINKGTVTGGRVSFGLKPLKELDIRFSAQQQEQDYDGASYASYTGSGTPIAGALVRNSLRIPESFRRTDALSALNVELDAGWAKLYSITGYQTLRNRQRDDFNEGYLRVFPPFLAVQLVDGSVDSRFRRTTQELRAVSNSGGPVDWLAGAFYSDESADYSQPITAQVGPGSPFPNPASLTAPNNGIAATWRETAVYGTLVWNVSPALALTAGARAARNSLNTVQRDFGLITSNSIKTGSTSESPSTYLLAARYKLTPASSLYVRAASGYRAGGPNNPAVDPATGASRVVGPYKSDSLWSYEAGYKADLPGGRGGFDVALFQIDWKDLQVTVFDRGASYQGNAGKAQVRGLELGAVLRPVDSLTLRAAASFLNAQLKEDSPGLQGKSGERLPYSPKVAASLNARYEISALGVPSFVAAGLAHTGARTVSYAGGGAGGAGFTPYTLPAYTTLDVNAGASVAGFELGAYVRNLTDERGQLSATTLYGSVGGPTNVQLIRPRTIGLTLSRSF